MPNHIEQELYDIQITSVVHGFIEVWNKFEFRLSKELAQIQERLDAIHPASKSHSNPDYELFYRVSNSLYSKDNLTMGELSSALSVPLSTATRIADRLVDNGYIQRLPDAEDRRIVRVALTNIGREIHETIDRYVRQRLQQVLSSITDEERTTLIALVSKVVSSLREETE